MKPNIDLRFYARGKGVSLWEVAGEYKVHENTIINRLRKEFTTEEKNDFKATVDYLAAKKVQ